MIEIKNLSKDYDGFEAIRNINLKVKEGKIIGLLGPNGSGKSTLIKLICGLLSPSEGEILINKNNPGVISKKIISYLPEKNALNLSMTIKQAIKYYQDFFEDFDNEKAKRLVEDLDLDINERLKYLSKGNLEKVQLILVISRKAKYYLLDEPIGGVDPAARDYIIDIILNNFNKKATIIISTHLIRDIERMLDEVVFINKGEIKIFEDAEKLRGKKNQSIDEIFREEFKC